MQINVPIFDQDFRVKTAFEVENLGFFRYENKFSFIVPTYVVQLEDSNIIYEANCMDITCKRWELKQSDCLTDMIVNGTSKKCSEQSITPFCSVLPIQDHYLVSFRGTYRAENAIRLVKHSGNIIVRSGTIYGHDCTFLELLHRPYDNYSTIGKLDISLAGINESISETKTDMLNSTDEKTVLDYIPTLTKQDPSVLIYFIRLQCITDCSSRLHDVQNFSVE